MKHKAYITIVVAMLMLPILASCRQELCYDHYPTVDMSFDWEREWERDYGKHHLADWDAAYHGCEYNELMPGKPEWVNMVQFNDDGTTYSLFLSPEGRKINMSGDGINSMLFYNGDTEYIVLHDIASLYNARATATSRSRASLTFVLEKYPNARSTNPPDILYAAYIDNVPHINNHEVKPIPVKMQPLVYTYVITYEFEHGLENVALARGALGGMAESVYLRDGTTSEETSIILFDCDIKPYGCRTEVRSFGIPGFPDIYYGRTADEAKDRTYTLNLEAKLKNGKTVEFNFDITDQMKNQPRGGVIKVTGLRIEDEEVTPPPPTSSGFDVEISDWDANTEVISLPIKTS